MVSMTISAWESDPMARDNAACNRAIRKAWARERELVLAGKGSRNWTSEQREQLITKGKVYDADGKAFIGQHMKSVSGFPDNQGDADNIQLLSQEEHLEAHKGDWHNVTNWYYDPDTKIFYDFDVYDYSKFPPDDYINFHPEEARILIDSSTEESKKKQVEEKKPPEKKKEEPPKQPKAQTPTPEKPKPKPPNPKIEPPKKPGFLSRVCTGAKSLWTGTVWPFIKEHPLETAGLILGGIKAGHDIKDAFSGDRSSERSSGIETSDDYTPSVDMSTDSSDYDAEEIVDDTFTDEEDDGCEDTSKGTHKSPCPHLRHVGERKFKTKDGYVYHDIGDVPVNGYDPTSIDSDEE